ncbi:MAG: HDOD domain-containing protein [Limisphaerales bacterium]
MNSVLFVDDEPLMRELYRNLSRELGADYQVRTVSGGVEALKALETEPVDIIVSDLAMPEMPGGEFLTTVERLYPDSMRVIISGVADELAVARCLMYGHRYFQKPLDLKEIATLVRRVSKLRKVIRSDRVKKIVGRSDVLPTPPETYLRLTELLQDPDSSLEEVARIVESDPGLTAKLLQVVNSAAFGYGGELTTVLEAVQMAGVEIVRSLLLVLQARNFAEKRIKNKQLAAGFWKHSLETGARCRALSRAERLDQQEQTNCFTAGLLHDIGKLVLAASDEKEYGDLVATSAREGVPLFKKELEVYEATHADIGAYLLGFWGLPDAIVHAVERHHSLGDDLGPRFTPTLCVHVAQNLVPVGDRIAELEQTFLIEAGLDSRIPEWEETIRSSDLI